MIKKEADLSAPRAVMMVKAQTSVWGNQEIAQ